MIKVRIQSENREAYIPETWEELTFRQYLNILTLKEDTPEAIIMALLDIHQGKLQDWKDIKGYLYIIEALNFLKKKPKFKKPNELLGKKLPNDLAELSVKQFQDLQIILRIKELKDLDLVSQLSCYPSALAVYLMDNYDSKQLNRVSEKIWDLPASDVFGTIDFFLKKLKGLKSGTRKGWNPFRFLMPKVKQDLTI